MRFLDKILDLTVFFSFDSYGYKRHKKYFNKNQNYQSLEGKVCLITGANKGIGFYTAEALCRKGAKVYLLCRDSSRGKLAVSNLVAKGYKAILETVDVSESESIRKFTANFSEKKVDILIHNAGLIPNKRILTNDNVELAFATHLLGPHLLTSSLVSKLKGGRVIWITSGGMYLKKFTLSKARNVSGKYNGISSYAYTKRGQVILADIWSAKLIKEDIIVSSMHPGWVDTPGIRKYLPGFTNFLNNRLRSKSEGADTIIWLATSENVILETGKLWFDRKKVKKYLWFTKERLEEKRALWDYCNSFYK